MITSFIDGRVRIRAKALKDEKNMAMVLTMINAQDGVLEVTPNARTGSVLVLYDPEKISRETLLEAASLLEKQFPPEEKKPLKGLPDFLSALTCRREFGSGGKRLSPLSPLGESALMTALYLATAVTGFSSKRAHIALGTAFAGLAALHLYDRRRCLKP